MVPEDMSHKEDRITNPSKTEKKTTKKGHLPSYFSNKSHSQKDTSKTYMNQSTTNSSKEDNLKKWEALNKMINFLDVVRIGFWISLFALSLLSMTLLYLPFEVFGMSLYSFFFDYSFFIIRRFSYRSLSAFPTNT